MAPTHIANYFSCTELARLEEGLPRLEEWSSQLLVPFPGKRIHHCSVAWINTRWFEERQFDLRDKCVRERITSWLLDEFSYLSAAGVGGNSPYNDRTLYADRYGSTSGHARHGGSGRVATYGCFQAKGIGQTPLVGLDAAIGHSHGCMSLAEAAREAIYGEIVAAEFPHSAVPVIAIIDLHSAYSSPDLTERYDQNVRRGIAVRPAAVRIAHAQRAPLFKRSATEFVNSQVSDATRTRDVVMKWFSPASFSANPKATAFTLQSLFGNIVEQIAFGQVHRLFCGGFFSSNLDISGALMDFGNMHALSDWSRAQVHSVVDGFGSEMKLLQGLVSSLAFYCTKYLGYDSRISLSRDLYEFAQLHYANAWRAFSVGLFGVTQAAASVRARVHDAIRRYYLEQQRSRMIYRFGERDSGISRGDSKWLYEYLTDQPQVSGHRSRESEVLREIAGVLRGSLTLPQRQVAWHTAERLLRPRETIDRKHLLEELAALCNSRNLNESLSPEIERYISTAVDSARRYWARMPLGLGTLGHTSRNGSSAVLVTDGNGPLRRWIWMEGLIGADGTPSWFESPLSKQGGSEFGIRRHGAYWTALMPVCVKGDDLIGCLPEGEIHIPAMTVIYTRPADGWYV